MNPLLCSAIQLHFKQNPDTSFTLAQIYDAIHPPFEYGDVTEHEVQQALTWLVQNDELDYFRLYKLPEPKPVEPEAFGFDNIPF
ncbi:MAG: hypothetical protein F6J87_28330 [Spirulina sp. SIO3F2]|nr:hypothetical protein [Spirulina sp. SIO3F2]